MGAYSDVARDLDRDVACFLVKTCRISVFWVTDPIVYPIGCPTPNCYMLTSLWDIPWDIFFFWDIPLVKSQDMSNFGLFYIPSDILWDVPIF